MSASYQFVALITYRESPVVPFPKLRAPVIFKIVEAPSAS